MRGLWWMLAVAVLVPGEVGAQEPSLRGSPAAMREQHAVARRHDLTFFRTREQIREAAERGELVPLTGDAHHEIASFVDPRFVRPEALSFIEHTARRYHQACGEPLVVTSGVRATADQPWNAHELSVHPAGIAVDLRVSRTPECREWLEDELLELERRDLVNATRERRPPHYHIAVYPAYVEYAAEAFPPEPEIREEQPVAGPVEITEPEPRRSPLLVGLLILLAITAAAAWVVARAAKEARAREEERTTE